MDSAKQVVFAKTATFAYNPNGNMSNRDDVTNIQYDSRNLSMYMQKNGNNAEYRYNAAGQRIYKKVFGATNNTKEHFIQVSDNKAVKYHVNSLISDLLDT